MPRRAAAEATGREALANLRSLRFHELTPLEYEKQLRIMRRFIAAYDAYDQMHQALDFISTECSDERAKSVAVAAMRVIVAAEAEASTLR